MPARKILSAALVIFLLVSPAPCVMAMLQPDEQLRDPALEARAEKLGYALRCIVCQSESINDSPAGIARDIRILIRQQLQAGKSEDQIIAFLKARYGDEILLAPPLQENTLLLWGAPVLVLAMGSVVLWRLRRGMPQG